jgi:hypothetical protein
MHLLFKNEKTTHFLNEISSKNFKSLNGPRLIHVYQYHTIEKNSPKNSTDNFSFEVYMQFFQIL